MTVSVPVRRSRPTIPLPRRGGTRRLTCPEVAVTAAVYVIRRKRRPGEGAAVRAVPADGGFDVRWSMAPTTCTVWVAGEVDSLTAPLMRDCLLDLLARPQLCTDVMVDLSQVTFLGSAGLTALVLAHQGAGSAGRALRVRSGSARVVDQVLDITGLSRVLTVVDRPQPGTTRCDDHEQQVTGSASGRTSSRAALRTSPRSPSA